MSAHTSPPNRPLARNPRLRGVSPSDLAPSAHHVRGRTEVSDPFIRNVAKVGLVHAPVCRREDGTLRVVDGMRRVLAAERAELDEIPVIVYDLSDAEAMEVSLTLNLGVWRNAVTDRDEEAAMRTLLGGPRRPYRDWEDDSDLFEAKYALGLADDTDRMMREVGGADGVGEATALALAETFDNPESLQAATLDDLQRAPGIGPKTAQNIRIHLDIIEEGGTVVVWDEDDEDEEPR